MENKEIFTTKILISLESFILLYTFLCGVFTNINLISIISFLLLLLILLYLLIIKKKDIVNKIND
jgi:hypothetical protein